MCSYGHIASKSAHAALNLYDYANVKTHRGNILRHLESWLEVVHRSLLRRKRSGCRHTSERIHQQYCIPACQPCVTLFTTIFKYTGEPKWSQMIFWSTLPFKKSWWFRWPQSLGRTDLATTAGPWQVILQKLPRQCFDCSLGFWLAHEPCKRQNRVQCLLW